MEEYVILREVLGGPAKSVMRTVSVELVLRSYRAV
jgi:hypothetical protein